VKGTIPKVEMTGDAWTPKPEGVRKMQTDFVASMPREKPGYLGQAGSILRPNPTNTRHHGHYLPGGPSTFDN